MGFDDTQDWFVGTYMRRGKKRSKHNRKARSLAKRNAWLGDEEEILASDPVVEPEEALDTFEPAEATDYGYDEDEADGLIPLEDYDMARVSDAYDRLDALEEVIRYLPSIRPYLDDDFYDQLDEALGFTEQILSLGTIDNTAYLDGLASQVNFLERVMADARTERDADKAAEAEALAKAEAEAEAEARAKAKAEAEALERAAGKAETHDGPTTALLPKPERRSQRQQSRKQKKKRGQDITQMLFAARAVFPRDFDLAHYDRRAVFVKQEVLDVDRLFMDETGDTGYCTGFYKLVPRQNAVLTETLYVHAHFKADGKYRGPVKVIPEGYEGRSDGSTTGSSNCVTLDYGTARRLGVARR